MSWRSASRSRKRVLTLLSIVAIIALGSTLGGDGVFAKKENKEERAQAQLKLAHSLHDAGRLGEALSTVGKALDQMPRYPEAHLLRGIILFQLDAVEEALGNFDKTLDLDKKNTEARNWRAFALVQLERFDEAMAEYKRALEDLTYPTPEKIHCNIGMLHRLMGDSRTALVSLRKAIELNPSYARGYLELGITYDGLGRDDEALEAFQNAQVGLEEDPGLNLRLGIALLKAGKNTMAREHFEKVIRLAPGDSQEAAEAKNRIAMMEGGKPSS